MKKWVAIAALLLVTGCSANQDMKAKQQAAPAKRDTGTYQSYAKPAPSKNHLRTTTQASSISTQGAAKNGMRMQSEPGTMDWQDLYNPGQTQAPAGDQAPLAPVETGTPNAANPGQERQGSPNTGATSTAAAGFEQQVLDLVNQERTKAGLTALTMNNTNLTNAAMAKARDMYDHHYFDHNSPTYGSPFDMMKSFGVTYTTAGENIASGQTSATQVMNDWMNSPGHRANILNSGFTQIGIAFYNGQWVQEFIG
ncbi:CAP domain-containing protein [Paenibacillus gansuensis]|uniref:CAP domain-containing protein n=1 Tax=Paenibacillus gansuensis TaxID=306542 RepID=A0ABW5PJF8_9BACL